MKVYLVEAFSSEPYDRTFWIDKVFSSLESAQAYVNKHRDKNGRAIEIKSGDGQGYFLSSYITTRELLDAAP